MPHLGIVPTSALRLALQGAGVGAALGGLYMAGVGVVLALGAADDGPAPGLFDLVVGAVFGAPLGLAGGLFSGLAIGGLLEQAAPAGAADRTRAVPVPTVAAVGFALVTGVTTFPLVSGNDPLPPDLPALLLFAVLPTLLAAAAGRWLGTRFLAWYATEWEPPAPRSRQRR